MRWIGLVLLAIWLPAAAGAAPSGYCARAALKAAAESGVPREVLLALAGDDRSPVPWTIVVDGTPRRFEERDAALGAAYRVFHEGVDPFAIGCFRIDFDLHGRHFASLDEMFDPLANARFAARYLSLLHADLGDWPRAVAAYADRDGDFAMAYGRRLDTFRDPSADAAIQSVGAGGIGAPVPLGPAAQAVRGQADE